MSKNNLFPHEDSQIIHRRKMGQSLFEIYTYFQSCEPLLDSVISLNHVCRICHEAELSFTYLQIKKVFTRLYDPSTYLHEGRTFYVQCPKYDALKFLRSFSGNKHISIKLRSPKKKVLSRIDIGQKSSTIADNSKDVELPLSKEMEVSNGTA